MFQFVDAILAFLTPCTRDPHLRHLLADREVNWVVVAVDHRTGLVKTSSPVTRDAALVALHSIRNRQDMMDSTEVYLARV